MRESDLKDPVFETDNFFRVTFYRNPANSLKKTVVKTVDNILALIRENPKITQKDLVNQTGLTRRGVEWNIKKLKDDGLIVRVGSAKGGYWKVVSE